MPQGTDLEQLSRLRLHALGTVDDHDGAVGGHQGPVGILGEVLVARGVQNVDAEAVVLELHDGGGHGDAALLFNLHPVGGGGPGPLALDLTGLGDGAAVKQEFFRQGRFAGVGVGNNRKCSAPGDFFLQSRHETASFYSQMYRLNNFTTRLLRLQGGERRKRASDGGHP